MKKFKLIMMAGSVLLGVGGAFAFKTKAPCELLPQYRYNNGVYTPAGEYAVDYVCSGSLGTCTYYKPWPTSNYIPCQSGTYIPIQ